MAVSVVLNMGNGDLNQGFPSITASVRVKKDHKIIRESGFAGSLPANYHLIEIYEQWHEYYNLIISEVFRGSRGSYDEAINYDTEEYVYSESDGYITDKELDKLSNELQQQLNKWLESPSFLNNIEFGIRTQLNPEEEIWIILQTSDPYTQKLPWHSWKFFNDYQNSELALSTQAFSWDIRQHKVNQPLRMLAVLGNSLGINVEEDKKILENFPAEIVFLVEPTRRELNETLWHEQGWDILFFAGHSSSEYSLRTGEIEINKDESITITQLRSALRAAIVKGLKLAIFNSCDGLGLANSLADLELPQLIVMRESVPDLVAQHFLKNWLLALKNDKPFYQAVREAREKLQSLESEYRCASWLPIICQNPATEPPEWHSLLKEPLPEPKPTPDVLKPPSIPWWKKGLTIIGLSAIATIVVMALRLTGMLQGNELQAFDQLMRQRPYEPLDDRLLVVQVTEKDIKQQKETPKNRASLGDGVYLKLFQKLQQYEPVVIGLDIYRDFAVDPEYSKLAKYLQQSNVFGICKTQDPSGGDSQGIAPAPEFSNRVAFSDAFSDEDNITRRMILSMNAPILTDPCVAKNHLSLLLALYYLQTQGIKVTTTPTKQLLLENPKTKTSLLLEQITPNFGGYNKIDARGRQIMINFRSGKSLLNVFRSLSVDEVINDKVPAKKLEQLKNKIILIGVVDNSSTKNDYWSTPYSSVLPQAEKETPGVFLQAHNVSQIISAVLNNRPLIWVWPMWVDILWINFWALIGAITAYFIRLPLYLTIGVSISLGLIYALCSLIIWQGGWVPLIPAVLALIISAIGLKVFKSVQKQKSKDTPYSAVEKMNLPHL